MTNLIRPILTNDGIELYVADSEDCGMSIAGIARFVGKHKRLIGVAINVIKQLQCGEEISKINEDAMVTEDIRRLEMFVYKGLDSEEVVLPINAIKNATVVNSNAVALIVQYYAYYAKNQTDIAKISHGKFANIGIKSWIKTTAGVDQIASIDILTALKGRGFYPISR